MKTETRDVAGHEKVRALTSAEKIDGLILLLCEKGTIEFSPAECVAALEKFHDDLEQANKKRRDALVQALSGTTEKLQANIRRIILGVVFLTLFAAVLSGGLVFIFQPTLDPSTMPVNSATILTFLGFVVALAAYLATLVRSLKDKITELKKETKVDAAQIATHAENLMRVIRAEALLVAVGFLTAGRIVFGPLMNVKVLAAFDYFLSVYMVFVILYLGYLHARQWTYQSNAVV